MKTLKNGMMLASVIVMGAGLVTGCGSSGKASSGGSSTNSSNSTTNNTTASNSSSNASSNTSNNSSSSNSSSSSSSGAVTITWMAGAIAHKGMRQKLINAFEKANPNIKVKLVDEPASTDTTRAQLTTSIGSGAKTPDVYLGDVIWPTQFGSSSLAQPLNSLFPKDFWNRFSSGLVKGATYKGKVYAAPFFVDTAFLFYRKDLLKKAGISSPPTTWEQVKQDSETLQKKKLVQYGFIWQGSSYEGLTCDFEEYLSDAGGKVLNSSGKPAIDSPQTTKALTFMKSLITSGVTPKAVTTDKENQSMNLFASGKAAFLRNWSYAWGVSQDKKQSKVVNDVGVTILPTFKGQSSHYSTIGGWDLYLNPHSQHMKADAKFIDFLTGSQGQKILGSYGEIPTNAAVAKSMSQDPKASPIFKLLNQINYVSRPDQTPNYPALSKVLYQNVNAVLAGSKSVATATKDMQTQLKSTTSNGGL